MNAVDIVLLSLIGGAAVLGAVRGFVWQFARLAGALGGCHAARVLDGSVAGLMAGLGVAEPWGRYLGYLGIFLVVLLSAHAAAIGLKDVLARLEVSDIDRWAGALLGLTKGVVIAYVGVYALLCIPGGRADPVLRRSATAPALLRAADHLGTLLAEEFHRRRGILLAEMELPPRAPSPDPGPRPVDPTLAREEREEPGEPAPVSIEARDEEDETAPPP